MSTHNLHLRLLTVSAAREANFTAEIAALTGLASLLVQRRLEAAPDEITVGALFESEWPRQGADIHTLGAMTAAAARQANLPAELAKLTALPEWSVRRRLAEANGNKTVWRVFAREWPDLERVGGDVEYKAASDSRQDRECIATIGRVTGLSTSTVEQRLESASSEATVGEVFAREWPLDGQDRDDRWLGGLRVSAARSENWAGMIAFDIRLSEAVVRARLESSPGQALVRNVFKADWPTRGAARDSRAKRLSGNSTVTKEPSESPTKRAAVGTLPGQGGAIHRSLQEAIASLGMLKCYHAETDKPLAAGFRPDVAWFRITSDGKPQSIPHHVFEIERGSHSARAKSIQSLLHAHELYNAKVTLIVEESSIEAIRGMVPAGLSAHLKLHSIQDCHAAKSPLELAQVLELELGTRR